MTNRPKVGDAGVVEADWQYSVEFCCRCQQRGSHDRRASDMEVHMKQRPVTEFLQEENITPTDIH